MAASERTHEQVSVPSEDVASVEMHDVFQRWVVERVSWLRARAQELSAAPTALFQRAVIPPKRIIEAAHPRVLIRTISDTGALLGTRLTSLERIDRRSEIPAPTATLPPAPTPPVDKMRGYWKARVDVLHKMLEKKPSL
jgi:hypothetical protein